jgi:hypothetical protein
VLGSLPPEGLTSIHPTAEKGNSQKFIFRSLHTRTVRSRG